MYWTDAGTAKIQRANLDGSGVEDLVTSGLSEPFGLDLDLGAGKMYWTDAGTAKIQRANLDGSGVEDLVTSGLSEPFGDLDLGAGKMYWTDAGTAKIQRANLDGSGVEDLVTSPAGLALDLGAFKMYWTDAGTAKIQRANLDGSGVEDLVTSGLSAPVGRDGPGLGRARCTGRADEDGSNDPAGHPGRERGGRPRHCRECSCPSVWTWTWAPARCTGRFVHDPAGQPGRERGGRPRHLGSIRARRSGAGPGEQLKLG